MDAEQLAGLHSIAAGFLWIGRTLERLSFLIARRALWFTTRGFRICNAVERATWIGPVPSDDLVEVELCPTCGHYHRRPPELVPDVDGVAARGTTDQTK